jgi:SAM-dependent methyltransferase
VPDPLFAHPRLAPVYDAFDGQRDDLTVYLRLAGELGADRVLDVGCGTGSLAILLAAAGRTVVGVDPAGASLEVAKSKEKTSAITWIHGDATRAPRASADLAVMTGNVAQVFLADEDWGAVIISDSTLRFRARDEVESSLAGHGFRVKDVREAPDRPGREFVFITERIG